MKVFQDEAGASWVADVREEHTPRHHGRWFLVIHAEGADDRAMSIPEIRWQTRATAERTLLTMSDFELRRRLHSARERLLLEPGASPTEGAPPESLRQSASRGG